MRILFNITDLETVTMPSNKVVGTHMYLNRDYVHRKTCFSKRGPCYTDKTKTSALFWQMIYFPAKCACAYTRALSHHRGYIETLHMATDECGVLNLADVKSLTFKSHILPGNWGKYNINNELRKRETLSFGDYVKWATDISLRSNACYHPIKPLYTNFHV